MKRHCAFLLCINLLLALCGCGAASSPSATSEATTSEPPAFIASREALEGKKVIFVGNSRTYYGKCVLEKGQSVFSLADRANDQGYFYQICKANGVNVSVTNFTFGNHNPSDFYSGSCAANRGHDGYNHLADLTDRNYDYVVFQGPQKVYPDALSECQKLMDLFLEGNPNTKFVILVHDAVHSGDFNWRSSIKDLENAGVLVVDWGALVNDLINGTVQIPGGTQTCDKFSFIVHKSEADGYHPNVLTGYITAQMLYCALTGESAQGMDYSFWNDIQVRPEFDQNAYMAKYYAYDSNTNFADIFASEADMAGIQQLIDQYLEEKSYRNY